MVLTKSMNVRGAALLALALSLALAPVDASALQYSLDGNDNNTVEVGGPDDLSFNLAISGINGVIKAADINFDASQIDTASAGVDWALQDVFFFQVTLNGGSPSMDEIGVSLGVLPIFSNPVGLGYLNGGGVAPTSFSLPPFTGRGDFIFGTNLAAGQTSRILFATFLPLGTVDEEDFANFMISSGLDGDVGSVIAPEPSAALLLLLGGTAFAASRRRR